MENKKEKHEKTVNIFEKKENIEKNNIEENDLINSLEIKLKESQEQLIELQLENHEEITKLNNRLNNEIEKSRKFSLEKIIIEFLLIIDNVERASSVIKENKENFYLEIIKKINFILSLSDEILNEFNVLKINEKNVLFNPDIHQAMSVSYNNEIKKDNHVLDIMQSGYILHKSRLLRPAMVVVSTYKNN
ncbi:nucleotide exchange factor GrpE [Buchnera aphidicola (Rhopalosiphum padi)]|uniref:Protein GrpE n=1 Tax=Buchnera aphidicola subsp. Rhopalosiphum padi TaxID=98793 RepID=A0A4D6YG16_BUCRP|nr:nucleotide exchange factor GrpE [Buchnera aphidicola]QCI24894.1 nucleotide exchange factor GrpE [Buchnera aphidicola (Rhopalosiphum padi)]